MTHAVRVPRRESPRSSTPVVSDRQIAISLQCSAHCALPLVPSTLHRSDAHAGSLQDDQRGKRIAGSLEALGVTRPKAVVLAGNKVVSRVDAGRPQWLAI